MNDKEQKPHIKAFSHCRGNTGRMLTFEEYRQKYPDPQINEDRRTTVTTIASIMTFAQFMLIARDADAQSKETNNNDQPDENEATETTPHTGSQ